jgi:putative nucleotidyltransferase with HDIG domain
MRLWEHCLAVGTLAEILREQYCRSEEAAFVAGLLHDIGILILDEYFAPEWGPALARSAENPERPLIEWETEMLGMNHAEAGYYLSERWNLPWALSQAILNHHRIPAEDSASVLDAMIYLSNALVKQQRIGFSGDPYAWPVNRGALALFGVRQEDLGNVTELLGQRMESMRALLGFLAEDGK